MSTRIDYDDSSAFGQQLAELAADYAEFKGRADNLKAAFESMAEGGTFERVEAEVGGLNSGDGQLLYNIVVGAASALNGFDLAVLWRVYRG